MFEKKECLKCNKLYFPFGNGAHSDCCTHDELVFTEHWIGDQDSGAWELAVECLHCGSYLDKKYVIENYKAIKK